MRESLGAKSYTCAKCGGTFDKGWSDEEAAAELAASFAVPLADCDLVCDPCYTKFRAWLAIGAEN
ncbi:MAG: hypothetical protein ACRYG4_04210 [Janthinobacterium lividum]